MKKVCHITTVHKWNDVRIFEKECVSLANAGYDVTLLVLNGKKGEEQGVKLVSVNYVYKSRLSRMINGVNKIYYKAAELNADIYHLHDPELLRIAKKLIRNGKKVIYDSHEDLPRQILNKNWIPSIFRKAISSTIEGIENRITRKVSGIVAATPYIKDRFMKINKNTVNINNYPLNAIASTTDVWENKKQELCYVGGLQTTRGAVQMVDVLGAVDAKLNLAGEIDSTIKQQLENKSSWAKVNFWGFVGRNQVNEIYTRSKIGLVVLHPTPSYIHSLPIKMFEYMAAAIPFVASDFPLWKSIVEKHKCGICVNPMDVNAIADAINFLLSNDTEAKEMGKRGRMAVEREYNWKNEELKLATFYNQLLKG